MKKKTENVIKRLRDIPEEEQRAELIRLRDMCLDAAAAAQRIMGEYAARANQCTRMLQEMDVKGVSPRGKKEDVTFDDGDDWDWGW